MNFAGEFRSAGGQKVWGTRKKSAPRIANVAATPITRWKWQVTKSSLTAAAAKIVAREKNSGESAGEKKVK